MVTVHPLVPDVLTVECKGPLGGVAPELKEVVVGVLCGMALLRGAHVYAPGVLGVEAGVEAGMAVSVWADVDGKCLQGRATKCVWQCPPAGMRNHAGGIVVCVCVCVCV